MADIIAYLINPVSHDRLRLAISQRRFLMALHTAAAAGEVDRWRAESLLSRESVCRFLRA